jgi:glycosyltransferase involved in cell wall biosynthesis
MKQTLIVSPEKGGHCPFYLSLLAESFTAAGCRILADSSYVENQVHLNRRNIIKDDFEFIKPTGHSTKDLLQQIRELVVQYKFDTVFFAYFDAHIEALLRCDQAIGCSISGIWFHPYALDKKYRWLPPFDKRLRTRRKIHKGLKDSLNTQEIKHLFFLDELSPSALKAINQKITSCVLVDPGEQPPKLNTLDARNHFALPKERTVFLHAGSSEPRKGFPDVLKAFHQLSKDPAIKDKALLLRVGDNSRLADKDRKTLGYLIEKGLAYSTDECVPHADFIEYFSAADWVIIPYRKFRYSSGIFANAITSNTPVIASNYGLIGRYASQLKNGDVYTHKSWKSLERAVRRHVDDRRSCRHADSKNHSKSLFIEQIRATG